MKSLKVLLVLLMSGSAYAAPSVYGKLKLSFGPVGHLSNTVYQLNSNNSRIGFKGSENLGNWEGVSGFYNIQLGWQPNDQISSDTLANRIAFAGIKGRYGSIKFGRLSYGYKMISLKMDPFYDTSAGEAHGGKNFGLSSKTNGWFDNSIEFTSMEFAGVKFNLQITADETNNNSQHDLNFGITYTMKDVLEASIQYLADKNIEPTDEAEYLRFNVRGWFQDFEAGISYENVKKHVNLTDPSQKFMYATASYRGLENTKFSVSYGSEKDYLKAGTKNYTKTGTGITLGSFYSLSDSTTASVIYSKVNYSDAYKLATSANRDREVFAIGLETNF